MNDQRTPPPGDRRDALKARHRRAIIDAASDLVGELGGTHFTVDRLAERADVSRRTVFNHFGSLDDIVVEVFGEMLETIIDGIEAAMTASADSRPGGMFDEVAAALRATDLVTPITRLKRLLRRDGHEVTPSRAGLFEQAINGVSARLASIVLRRHPGADPLVVDLMSSALVSGGAVVVQHWEQATGGADTEASRRVWTDLLERMIAVNRAGYGSVGSATP
ncbi:TetR/AcrR family transcriptional regulator [Nocardiopsis sediminis]|uniref:TetR/AcrR family transcriptional regulator n=1 Tax=Nocardiopsis sediminis TaxID=1778267 RepID=A0ABV8FRN6_9ACTN